MRFTAVGLLVVAGLLASCSAAHARRLAFRHQELKEVPGSCPVVAVTVVP